MISLEPSLAQEIVERTMQVIPFNVNVMDAHGIILGSGDPERLGEQHTGARLALAEGKAVEFDAAAARTLRGVKPGVNLPLNVRGKVRGVIGITGDPEKVRRFGELVRVMAEMILEQARLVSELQHEKRYREEFVDQLIRRGGTPRDDLELWGNRLGVDFRMPHSALVLELIEEGVAPDRALAELQACQQRLARHDAKLLMAVISPRELVILKALDLAGKETDLSELAREQLTTLSEVAAQGAAVPSAMALGVALACIEGAHLSYLCARRTLAVGRRRDPSERLFSFYDLSFPVLLSELGSGWQAQHLARPLRLLAQRDRSRLLRKSLKAWFDEDCLVDRAARRLAVHRNTLDYRLRKVNQITRLDLARIDDRLMLYAALQMEE